MKSFRQSCVPFRRLGVFLVVLLLSAILPSAAWSQAASGNIEGYVYDPTGARIPDTTVRLVNTETGLTRTVETNASGYYIAAQLPVGDYEITFVRDGFADRQHTGLTVQVGDSLKIDATLELAGVQEVITVTEASPLVEASRSGQASVIVGAEIEELPVNNRNWTELALLTPGVLVDSEFDGIASVSINGQEGFFNNIQVDGVDNNNAFFAELRGRTRAPFQFSQEAVREFRVLTNNFSAEYGRAAGGVINAVTKSGTNNFHGSAFWYLRDDVFNAAPYFVNAAGLPEPDTNRQQFGGTIGGPIARDKAFFFFSYDQQVRDDPVTVVLDPRSKGELYFNPLDFFNSTVPISTGANSFLDGVDGTSSRTIDFTDGNDPIPFVGTEADIVHQAFLNWAFARAYFLGDTSFLGQTFTTPFTTLQSINPVSGRTFANIERTTPRKPDQITFLPKLTVLLNDSHTFDFRWNHQDFESTPNGRESAASKIDNESADGPFSNESDSLVFSLSSVFTPSLLNEARFQYVRDDEDVGTNAPGAPRVRIGDFDFGAQSSHPRFLHEERFQIQDNLTIIKGRHQMKVGLDIIHTKDDNFFPGTFDGRYSFGGPGEFIEFARGFIDEVVGDSILAENYFGIDLADAEGPRGPNQRRFSLSNYQQRFGQALVNQTTVDYGFYFQDNIRLRPDFTLNLGLRYEFQQLQDPILPNPLIPETAEIPEDKNNFAPRIGLAWSPRSNLVVRAGYGLFYIRRGQLDVNNAITGNNAFSFNQFLSSTSMINAGVGDFNTIDLDPFNIQDSAFPNLNAPTTSCPSPPACADPFASISAFSPDYDSGYSQQSSLEIQWEFVPGTSVSVGYVHTKGTKLPRNRNINVPAQAFAIANARPITFVDESGNVITVVNVPDYQVDSFGTRTNRPNPDFSAINHTESAANTFYNAFLLKLERRWSRGLTYGISYTASKNVVDVLNGFNSAGAFFSDVFDQNNPRDDRGLARFDQRHNFVARLVWEPEFWSAPSGATRWALDGWSYGFIYTASTGRPLTGVVDDDFNRDNSRTAFGDGDRVPFLGRSTFTTQGKNNVNLSISKRFRFGEARSLQFRFQTFNLFNRPTFTRFNDEMFFIDDNDAAAPVATLNPNFLEPEGRALRSRDIQFGLVFRF